MDRRERGTGGVDEVPGRGWRARLRLPNGKRRLLGYYDTRVEAEAMLAAARIHLAGTKHDPKRKRGYTVASFAKEFLAHADRTRRDASGIRARLERYVLPAPIAQRRLTDVTPSLCRQWLRELPERRHHRTDKPLAKQTLRNARGAFVSLFNRARELDLVSRNPFDDAPLPKGAVSQETSDEEGWTFLSQQEIAALFEIDLTLEQRTVLALAIYAGLRQGELHGLRWGDVELEGERPQLVIRRSRSGPTKAGKVGRVPLLRPAVAALRRWSREVGEVTPEAFVFPSPRGGHYARGHDFGWSDRKRRRKGELEVLPGLKSRAGIERPVRFHDLRHTTASHLLMGSWAPEIVARPYRLEEVCEFLRHGDIAVTQRYAHLAIDSLHALASPGPELHPKVPEFGVQFGVQKREIGRAAKKPSTDSSNDSGELSEPPTRLELVTYGLRNRCSTN